MSWHFSQALVAGYLAGDCSAGGRFAPWSVKGIAVGHLPLDRMTVHWSLSRYGRMLDRSRSGTGRVGNLSSGYVGTGTKLLSRADFPARIFQLLESKLGLTGNDLACGGNLLESLGRYDRDTHTLRTRQRLLGSDSTECLEILPEWGSMRSGELYRRAMPSGLTALRAVVSRCLSTCGKGYGLGRRAPTPVVIDLKKGLRESGKYQSLVGFVQRLPTMTSSMLTMEDMEQAKYSSKKRPAYKKVLRAPTPIAQMSKHATATEWELKNARQEHLHLFVARLPTPMASDISTRRKSQKWKDEDLVSAVTEIEEMKGNMQPQVGGSLSPDWVEWLMGWPIGWTDLKPLGMDNFRAWLRAHGAV